MTAMLAGVTFFGKREATRPRIFPLILTAILLTVATLLVELLFVAAEVILVSSGLGETPPGVLLGIVLAGLGLFLIDFDLAFVIYVYRVANATPGEEVQLNLWPWEGWGSPQANRRDGTYDLDRGVDLGISHTVSCPLPDRQALPER